MTTACDSSFEVSGILAGVSAPVLEVAETVLADRAAKGLDKHDERWEGVWHIVNPPKYWHSVLSTELLLVLAPHGKGRSLSAHGDATGVYADPQDWRVPDLAFALAAHATEDGLSSAELVVEIRSPRDDTYEKLPFYASRGVREVLVVHRDRHFELRRLNRAGGYDLVEEDDGSAISEVLGVRFSTVAGPALRVQWDGGSAEI